MTQVDSLPFECRDTDGDASDEDRHRYHEHDFGFHAHKAPNTVVIQDYHANYHSVGRRPRPTASGRTAPYDAAAPLRRAGDVRAAHPDPEPSVGFRRSGPLRNSAIAQQLSLANDSYREALNERRKGDLPEVDTSASPSSFSVEPGLQLHGRLVEYCTHQRGRSRLPCVVS